MYRYCAARLRLASLVASIKQQRANNGLLAGFFRNLAYFRAVDKQKSAKLIVFFHNNYTFMNFLSPACYALALGCSVLFFSACGKGVDRANANAVAQAFLQAGYALDLKSADALANGSASSILQLKATGESAEEKQAREALLKAYKSATCKETGDKAVCTICCGADGKNQNEVLLMSKIEGKWTVTGRDLDYSNPEVVALLFMRAVNQMDFEKAGKFATKEIQPLLNMVAQNVDQAKAQETPEARALREGELAKMKSATCKVEGDKAICTLCCELQDKSELELVKDGEKWLVTVDKEKKEKNATDTDNTDMPNSEDGTVIDEPEAPKPPKPN